MTFCKICLFLKLWNFKIDFGRENLIPLFFSQWMCKRASEESLSCAANIVFLPRKTNHYHQQKWIRDPIFLIGCSFDVYPTCSVGRSDILLMLVAFYC